MLMHNNLIEKNWNKLTKNTKIFIHVVDNKAVYPFKCCVYVRYNNYHNQIFLFIEAVVYIHEKKKKSAMYSVYMKAQEHTAKTYLKNTLSIHFIF